MPAVRAVRSATPDATRGLRPGFALEATLLLLVLFGALVGAAVAGVTTFVRTAGFDARAARATYAAEGGADQIMAQLDAAMQDGAISNAELDALSAPELDGFRFQQTTTRNQRDRYDREPGLGRTRRARAVDPDLPVRRLLRPRPRDQPRRAD
ncbi:MAG: hypothetical protein MUF40_08250, partial [Gemmatimonadaceae bacterium]|nr:hypothetical protein [Gemmatimonadaceae bacterium]